MTMKTPEGTHTIIRELMNAQKLAVLATQKKGQPYASLVAFAATDDLKHIIFFTPAKTRKFEQLSANPQVALLINNSLNREADFEKAVAVTAVCHAGQAGDDEKETFMNLYSAKHPSLTEFARNPVNAMVKLTVQRFHLVENFQQVSTVTP